MRLLFANSRRPTRLTGHGIQLRFPEPSDYPAWSVLRTESREFLEPWEPRWPSDDLTRTGYRRRLRRYQSDAENGASLTWFIFGGEVGGGPLLGGLTLSAIRMGAARSSQLGYWMGAQYAGRGIMKRAVSLVLDDSFTNMGLERLEAACLPENERSIRLLQGLGFTREGFLRSYLEINGERRDHLLFARLRTEHLARPGASPATTMPAAT